MFEPSQRPVRVEAQQRLKQGDQPFAVGMQKAEVASASEAFGQHMLEDQPQEPGAGDRSVFALLGFAILVAKSHLAVFAGDNIFLLDHAFIEIAAQIDQRLLARADGLDIDNPGVGVAYGQFQSLLADGVEQFGAKDLGQRLVVEQITGGVLAFFTPFGPPPLFFAIEGGGRHHQMHVWVVVEAAGMGVQDRDGARRTLELRVVLTKRAHRLPATAGHEVIEGALMEPGQRPELFGQGEGHQKILGGDLFLELTFQPLLAFMVLAVRTVAMAAGMRHQDLVVALGTLRQHLGTG